MIEYLRICFADGPLVQREVVASGGEIRVLRVGLPYDAHAEDARVERDRAVHIGHLQREMSQSSMLNHWIPAMRYPTTAQIGSDGGSVGALRSIASIFSNAPLSLK